MSGLFGGGGSSPSPHAGILDGGLPKPRVVRMPTETDPSILEASKRLRENALKRTGRMSTILTDQLNRTVGSSGSSLGA